MWQGGKHSSSTCASWQSVASRPSEQRARHRLPLVFVDPDPGPLDADHPPCGAGMVEERTIVTDVVVSVHGPPPA